MKITSSVQLAQVLKNKRAEQSLSQIETAELGGIKQGTVSGFETRPDGSKIETLFKLLAALDLELHVNKRDDKAEPQAWDQEW